MRRTVVATAMLAASSIAGYAQVNLLPSTAWGFAPVISGWHFTTPIATSSGPIQDVAQAAVPFQVRVGLGTRWSFDITGAYAAAAIHTTSSNSASSSGSSSGSNQNSGGDQITSLYGPTDVKLRMSGPLASDRLVFTAGVNFPTGTTRLDGDQTAVLQTVGAPALNMPVAAYGIGAGGTLGLIGVLETAGWALAFGGSVEQRTEYTPIALAISGGSSDTRLTPGMAAHFSIGADRVVGSARLSILLLTDAYGTDKIVISDAGSQTSGSQYRLGPQLAGLARLDFGGGAWSEGALSLSARHRSPFNDADSKPVSGSDGNYLDGSLGGVLGGGNRVGLVIGVDGRWHSGLPFTNALVGAAVTAGGATLGVETRHFRFALHPQYGTFDTGTTHTTGYGGSLVLSFFAGRGDAQ